jgi:hypothetical protein
VLRVQSESRGARDEYLVIAIERDCNLQPIPRIYRPLRRPGPARPGARCRRRRAREIRVKRNAVPRVRERRSRSSRMRRLGAARRAVGT